MPSNYYRVYLQDNESSCGMTPVLIYGPDSVLEPVFKALSLVFTKETLIDLSNMGRAAKSDLKVSAQNLMSAETSVAEISCDLKDQFLTLINK